MEEIWIYDGEKYINRERHRGLRHSISIYESLFYDGRNNGIILWRDYERGNITKKDK